MTRLCRILGLFFGTLWLAAGADLSFSTYLGAAGTDNATGIAVDSNGYVYVAGWTESGVAGGVDATVTKLSPDGKTVAWRVFLGGNGDDRASAIASDPAGAVYVAGWTSSQNFPVKGAYQNVKSGGRDAFVVKLNPDGTTAYSTFFGGAQNDAANGIAVDSAGNVYVAGETTSPALPVQYPWQAINRGGSDAFVAKFGSAGNLLYATFLGGALDDRARAIAADGAGNAYITGETSSSDFPSVGALQSSSGGGQDAFVLKLSAGGNVMYSTYLGGSGGTAGLPESGAAIAVDAAGNAYVAGVTSSGNFPILNAVQSRPAGGVTDAFVARLNSSGNALMYSTYLGGSSVDYATAIAIDAAGSAWVAGYTASTDLPVKSAVQAANGGSYDAFVTQFSPDGRTILQNTYFGGSGSDSANAIVVATGDTYVAGQTASTNFPVKNPTQAASAGMSDSFVVRFTAPPKYVGVIDVVACDALAGWAWDTNRPSTPMDLAIYSACSSRD